MSVSTTADVLEARVRIHSDRTSATIAYFVVEPNQMTVTLEGLGNVRVTRPRKRAHLVTVHVGWQEACSMQGLLLFDLEREANGRDIPDHLPDELRYHVLMTSQAIFAYLTDLMD